MVQNREGTSNAQVGIATIETREAVAEGTTGLRQLSMYIPLT